MKKWWCILLIIIGIIALTSAYHIPYTVKCYKCAKTINSPASGLRSIAWRTFDECAVGAEEPDFVVYRCEHGHILKVNYKTKERK